MSKLFVIAAPSGTGKTSLIKALLAQEINNLKLGISFTTRKKRLNEREGKDYFFIEKKKFTTMLEKALFLEHAEVYENLYGTSKEWVDSQMNLGKDLILELDYQGALQVKNIYKNAVLVFILPPSFYALKKRLKDRDLDSNESIEKRLSEAKKEINYSHNFDHIIVNDNFKESLEDLIDIISLKNIQKKERMLSAKKTLKLLMEDS
ncbi:MAG: guanylate kinase [SAR86 cluster bacterium]|jgi:guanylate kinase|nr:guanylate kinase [SAR86 cluster bacterium]